jgi:hypothetical protein
VSASNFRDTLVELIDASPGPMDHPSADQWLASHRGELPAGEEAALQEHLVRCRECFDLAGAAAAFVEAGEKPGEDQEVETAALWRLLRPQLDPPVPLRPIVREISIAPRRRSWRFRLPEYLAASFFVALVGMTAWDLRLQSAKEALLAPRADPLVVDFSSGERAATLVSAERALTASHGPWMLVIHPPGDLPSYRLVLREAASGREQWSFQMPADRDLTLKIALPEGLRPGHYRLELSDGSGGGAGKVLETFRLVVKEAGKGA